MNLQYVISKIGVHFLETIPGYCVYVSGLFKTSASLGNLICRAPASLCVLTGESDFVETHLKEVR